MASAQVGGGGGGSPLACALNIPHFPQIRLEGITDAIADLVITCSGGPEMPNLGDGGAASNPLAPATDITVTLPTQVTSRLVSSSGVSEALLLIDEPNSGAPAPIPGFGPGEPFTPCPNPNAGGSNSGGCAGPSSPNPTYVLTQMAAGVAYQTGVTSPDINAGAGFAAPNVYQGVVSGNQVTFYGVPVIPPAAGGARVLRITNLRVNGSGMPLTSIAGWAAIQASISVSNPSVLPLQISTMPVGFEQPSLKRAVTVPTSFGRCNSETLAQSAVLTFQERLASAWNTRVDPAVSGQTNGQGSVLVQNMPGRIYASESAFTLNGLYGTGTAGLADSGTRLTAVINSIPAGVSVFVSQFGVTLDPSGAAVGEVSTGSSWAQAVSSESATDGAGTIPAATPYNLLAPGGTGNIHVIDITPQNGSTATATWEVMAADGNAIESYNFAVFLSYTGGRGAGAPLGSATATLRYGPASAVTGADLSANVPRFAEVTGGAWKVISIGSCGR